MTIPDLPDVSIVVFARNEGYRLHGCFVSVERAVAAARAQGFSVETLLVLRGAADETRDWTVQMLGPHWQIIESIDSGLGAARNLGRIRSRGRYMTFADGTDLWSENWITALLALSDTYPAPAVWRPEMLINTGPDFFTTRGFEVRITPPPEVLTQGYASLLEYNAYPSGFFAPRVILDTVPFPHEDIERGWDYVDWWWTCNVVAAGYHQRVAPGTFHYRRAVPDSITESTVARRRIGPTRLAYVDLPIAFAL